MAHLDDFDIDLHPIRMNTASVSQFELDSLYEAHTKTCTQLKASKSDCEALKVKNQELQAGLEDSKIQLILKSAQLDHEKVQGHRLSQQLTQEFIANRFLMAVLLSGRTAEEENGAAKALPNSVQLQPEQEDPSQTERENSELREKLLKMEALYDMLQQENESMKRQVTKLTSKLRILSTKNEETDDCLGTTIRKQGRFVVRKWLECDQCYQRFSSHKEMEMSTCNYHPMLPVPQVGEGRRKRYYLCCHGLAGQAKGCCKGKHHLSLKQKTEE